MPGSTVLLFQLSGPSVLVSGRGIMTAYLLQSFTALIASKAPSAYNFTLGSIWIGWGLSELYKGIFGIKIEKVCLAKGDIYVRVERLFSKRVCLEVFIDAPYSIHMKSK